MLNLISPVKFLVRYFPDTIPFLSLFEKQTIKETAMLTKSKTKQPSYHGQKNNLLQDLELFKSVSPDGIQVIGDGLSEKHFEKRETIFMEDDPAETVWLVLKGHVKEVNYSAGGRSIILSVAGPGWLFGVSALDGGKYGVHAVAETDSTVISFPIQSFRAWMERYPGLASAVITHVSKLLRHAKDMQTNAHGSAEKRLLRALVTMASQYGNTIPLTRQEIASMAGTTVETCIRAFSRLESEGLIFTDRGKRGELVIRNLDDLLTRIKAL